MRLTNPIPNKKFELMHGFEVPILTGEEVDSICAQLEENAQKYFSKEHDAIPKIMSVNQKWLDPDYELRKKALEVLPQITGFSKEMIETFGFHPFTWDLKFNSPKRRIDTLEPFHDGYIKSIGTEDIVMHKQPKLLTHILFGNVVGYDALTISQGIHSGSAQIVKVASGQPIFNFFYGESIAKEDPELRKTIFPCYWKGGDNSVEEKLFERSDIIDAWGTNETIADIKRRVAGLEKKPRVFENPHKIGVSFISKEYNTPKVAELAAFDVIPWSGMACYATKNIFLEGSFEQAKEFGKEVAKNIDRFVGIFGTVVAPHIGPEMLGFKESYEGMEYSGKKITTYNPRKGIRWLVAVDGQDNQSLQPASPVAPMVVVQAVDNLESLIESLGSQKQARGLFQYTSIAVPQADLTAIAGKLFGAGFTNVKTVGGNAFPKYWESHGGSYYVSMTLRTDNLTWVSIDTREIDAEIKKNLERLNRWKKY